MQKEQQDYWSLIGPIWDEINLIGSGDDYLTSIARLPKALVHLQAANLAGSEICNGGFKQLFQNCSGVLAPEAVAGFRQLGMIKTAQVVEAAVREFADPFPRDNKIRHSKLTAIPEELLAKLDEQFYALINSEAGGFQAAADAFASRIRG